jgi:hypothetical protein
MPDWCDEAAKRIGQWEFEMFRGEPYCDEWLDKMAQIIRDAFYNQEREGNSGLLDGMNQPLPGRNIGDGQ